MSVRTRARDFLSDPSVLAARRATSSVVGLALIGLATCLGAALSSWTVTDPSLTFATSAPARNLMGAPGAAIADPLMQLFGLGAPLLLLPFLLWGLRFLSGRTPGITPNKLVAGLGAALLLPGFLDVFPVSGGWPLPLGFGGVIGGAYGGLVSGLLMTESGAVHGFFGGLIGLAAMVCLAKAVAPVRRRETVAKPGFTVRKVAGDDEYGLDETDTFEADPPRFAALYGRIAHAALSLKARLRAGELRRPKVRDRAAPALSPTLAPETTTRSARKLPVAPEVLDEDDLLPTPLDRQAPEPMREATGVFRLPLRGPAARLRERPAASVDEGTEATFDDDLIDDDLNHDRADDSWDEPPPVVDAFDEVEAQLDAERAEGLADDDGDAWDARSPVAPRPPIPARPPAPASFDARRVTPVAGAMKPGRRIMREAQPNFLSEAAYEFPPLALLATPPADRADRELTEDALEANARVLEGVLDDFGVKGQIINVRPGPVVTLYELEPAPGIKSSRVIGLADDIARSMSAISARVAVIPGKNAIGIELPNRRRVTVFLRELLASEDFERTKQKLPMCLGKTIGGEAVIADLSRMPHLLVAGTTGSGKSVSINTMILSLLYHHKPETCRIILIDPKMLELSVYDGIPHLLTPVVTDPKKAVTALRWAVREMEDRYRKMAKLGVRNIDGYNARLKDAQKNGEPLSRIVQTGFDKATGEAIFEEEVLDLAAMPFIVCVVDEMADLMMVAGKDIEGLIQRLAQMARAAGIHLIMATQRPSVDVITGTIKANFPTRISFQVTSKIDSRTILAEMGAEQLLGMGDMLYMAGGGRIQRVHGPFVADEEVEEIVAHLRAQGTPEYLHSVLAEEDGEDEDGSGGSSGLDALAESDDLYDRAVALVLRDRKASTSYVQRRLSIGYNRAATLIERMEREGVVSAANHAGKRDILVPAEEEVA